MSLVNGSPTLGTPPKSEWWLSVRPMAREVKHPKLEGQCGHRTVLRSCEPDKLNLPFRTNQTTVLPDRLLRTNCLARLG